MIQVKICCISSLAEAKMAIGAGADILGLVSHMPSGPGVIEDQQIKSILNGINNKVNTFLLTSKLKVDEIIDQHNEMPCTSIQFVDYLELESLKILREQLPSIEFVQVVHVENESSIEKAKIYESFVDCILLDSGKPSNTVKILGGTGLVHNWEISAEIVKQLNKPVFLAGGLNSENVKTAISTVKPYGVDLCSGVRTDGNLDEKKLYDFMHEVRSLK